MPRGFHSKQQGELAKQRILEALTGKRLRVVEIVQATGICRSGIAKHLLALHAEPKQIFICGFDPKTKGRPAPIWTAGNQPDVEFVPNTRPTRKTTAAERRDQVLAELKRKPRCARELADDIHVVTGTVVRYITALRRPENRQLFIIRWNHPSKVCKTGEGGDWAPVYAVGTREDVPKPTETPSERHHRLMKDDAYREQRRSARRVYYQLEKARKRPNNWASALGL